MNRCYLCYAQITYVCYMYLWAAHYWNTLLCPSSLSPVSIPPSLSAVFQVEPEDILTTIGTSGRFDCSFTTSSPASLSWLHDGEAIVPGTRHTYLSNSSLQIDPIVEGDEGEYTCRVTVTGDVHERSATLTLACENGITV